jgi:hypothetical protein
MPSGNRNSAIQMFAEPGGNPSRNYANVEGFNKRVKL